MSNQITIRSDRDTDYVFQYKGEDVTLKAGGILSIADGLEEVVLPTAIEISGEAEVKVNKEVALKWLNNGAIPTDTVRDLLSKQGVMKEFHEAKIAKKKEAK